MVGKHATETPEPGHDAGDRLPPLLRAFGVLERIAAVDRPVSAAEIAELTGLPRPTAWRILATLESADLIAREPGSRRYRPGARLSRFALDVLQTAPDRGPRHLILDALAKRVGETCNLTMLDAGEVVYLDRVESAWPLRMTLQPGSRVPLHCTASGKLLLALMPAARRDRLVADLPLPRFTSRTIVDRARFSAELARIRRTRVATDDEEYLDGLVCAAVPVAGPGQRVVASVAVQAPRVRMSLEGALGHVPALREAAIALARTL